MAVARPEEPKQHVIKVNRALYARLLSISAGNNNCPIPNALDKLIEELQAKPPVVKTVERPVEKIVEKQVVKIDLGPLNEMIDTYTSWVNDENAWKGRGDKASRKLVVDQVIPELIELRDRYKSEYPTI